MITSISNFSQMQKPMHPQSQPLTKEQKETVNSILANYESSNMSEVEVESMKAEFKNAGIKPSEDFKGILEEAGFEVSEKSGPQGAKGGGRPKPPEFSTLMGKLENSDISEEEMQSYIQNLQNENGGYSGTIVDEYI
ncbi:MAG: hypothetical protein WC055_14005 [Melioribacteraceae bacterium]